MGLSLYITCGFLTLAGFRLVNDWIAYRKHGRRDISELISASWTPFGITIAAFVVAFWPFALFMLIVAVVAIACGWVNVKDLD